MVSRTQHLDGRVYTLGGHCHAGDDAAATDGHHEDLQVGLLREHLQRNGALPGNHFLVIVGMHQDEAAGSGELQGVGFRIVENFPVQDHLGAVTARVDDLHTGGVARHHDHRGDTEAPGVIGHALGVVARGGGDHACTPLLGRERQQLVQRAALLERGGELVILELQVGLGAGDLGQRARMHAGRAHDVPIDGRSGGADFFDRDRHRPVRLPEAGKGATKKARWKRAFPKGRLWFRQP